MKKGLIKFNNGLVDTNVLVFLEDTQEPQDVFNEILQDKTFTDHICMGECSYLGFEELPMATTKWGY